MSWRDNPEYVADLHNPSLSSRAIAKKHGKHNTNVAKNRRALGITKTDPIKEAQTVGIPALKAWGYNDWCEWLKANGQNPDNLTFTYGVTSTPTGGYFNKINNIRDITEIAAPEPKWQPIQHGPSFIVPKTRAHKNSRKWKTAVLMADTQIGYRRYEDGTLDPFHDEAAMEIALKIVEIENPDRTVVMGDIIDMAEQGRFAQEASFANTTQVAIDRTTTFAAQMRAATTGVIDWIEGNHDKRLQNFIETNAKAAFGIRKGNLPDTFPVMSIPNLCRLDEYGIDYHDAYPAAHVWVNDVLRAEHGDKINSSGSTAQKYMTETPHISRAFGHTHRLEALSKTTYDRMGKIRSMAINPGCLCRVDGAVPSVHGAIGANGRPAVVHENWQQGVAVIRYTDTKFFVDLVQIDDGRTVYQGQEITV